MPALVVSSYLDIRGSISLLDCWTKELGFKPSCERLGGSFDAVKNKSNLEWAADGPGSNRPGPG